MREAAHRARRLTAPGCWWCHAGRRTSGDTRSDGSTTPAARPRRWGGSKSSCSTPFPGRRVTAGIRPRRQSGTRSRCALRNSGSSGGMTSKRWPALEQRQVAFDFPRRYLAVVFAPLGLFLFYKLVVDDAQGVLHHGIGFQLSDGLRQGLGSIRTPRRRISSRPRS